MKQIETNLVPESSKNFNCIICNYYTSKMSQYNRHILTSKHKNETFETKMKQKGSIKFECGCGNKYNSRTTLWRHKKSCKNNEIIKKEEPINKDVIMMLIKENTELKNMVLDVCQKIQSNNNIVNSNNVINNSHNKTFNLQFFLNETCKDAMNIMDFVDSIKLQLTDLVNVGKLGYVEGISNIITSNLNALDVTQRPIHCADKKREVIYIKDENKWEKEDEQKNRIKKVIHRVVCKSQRLIPKFKEEHPDCLKASSKFSDQYNKIIVESMGGSGDNDKEKEEKIIRNISKQVIIDKNMD
jgi:hypothetical protein